MVSWEDASRTPPRGPAADGRYDNRYNDRDWDRRRDASYGRDEYRFRRSPSPLRGRGPYTDRDRQGYLSPSNDSRTRSRSGSTSSRGGQQQSLGGQPTKEIMMDGLSPQFSEDDVRHLLSTPTHNPIPSTATWMSTSIILRSDGRRLAGLLHRYAKSLKHIIMSRVWTMCESFATVRQVHISHLWILRR